MTSSRNNDTSSEHQIDSKQPPYLSVFAHPSERSYRLIISASTRGVASLSSIEEMSTEIDQSIRAYPSIKDYYDASKTTSQSSVHLQNGLSNYSTLVFGDDRISVSESMMNATYRPSVEDKMMTESPSKIKSKNHRRREYLDATNRVTSIEVDRLERVMKDKLVQRSPKNSSAFQVKKAFKFFDRGQSLRICIEGFTKALEFLGFQFFEIQNLALFARYDTEFKGEIIYMDFIHTAMFFQPSDDDMATRYLPDNGICGSSSAFNYEDDVKDLTLNQVSTLIHEYM